MKIALCILLGYLLGSVSPAALISKLKKVDLRKEGTGNLGATNTLMVIGKLYGIFVMVFDITKAVLAVKLAALAFPGIICAPLIAGASTVIGHMFPFYMKFKGGKGLASYGGMVLAFDPLIFIMLLVLCLVIMVIINYGVALTLSAACIFPILTGLRHKDLSLTLISTAISLLLIIKHIPVIRRVARGEDIKARVFMKKFLFSKRKNEE
ncbi:MAG: glycerol-3-phosphate acyltransferase [Ruminococcaceae bacterium]|nr:glycerol-3-phosphate acyltransferase [Oscillospiraceae bacterium]